MEPGTHACTANFDLLPPDTYSLDSGEGRNRDPELSLQRHQLELDCGTDCNETYDDGTVVDPDRDLQTRASRLCGMGG